MEMSFLKLENIQQNLREHKKLTKQFDQLILMLIQFLESLNMKNCMT